MSQWYRAARNTSNHFPNALAMPARKGFLKGWTNCMDQLLMLTILFAIVGTGAFSAHRYKSSKKGLRATLVIMAVFMAVYIFILVRIVPKFLI